MWIYKNLPITHLSQYWMTHIDQCKFANHTAVTMTATYSSMKICQPYSCHNDCHLFINENLPTIQLSQWLPHTDQWKSASHTAVTMTASYWSMKICQPYSCHNGCLILINENLPTIQLSQWLPHIDQWKSANHTAVTMTASYWSMKICQPYSCHNDGLILINENLPNTQLSQRLPNRSMEIC